MSKGFGVPCILGGPHCLRPPLSGDMGCILHSVSTAKNARAFHDELESELAKQSDETATIDLGRVHFPDAVSLEIRGDVRAQLKLRGAKVEHVQFDSAHFFGAVDLATAQIGSLRMSDCTFEALFVGLQCRLGKLSIFSTRFRAAFHMDPEVSGPSRIYDTRFESECRMEWEATGTVRIAHSRFRGLADFRDSTFNQALFVTDTNFAGASGQAQEAPAIADFRNVIFAPGSVFRGINASAREGVRMRLRDALCDEVHFVGVNWFRDGMRSPLLQDELDARRSRRGYELVADAYRRLVISYERNRAYEIAEGCYYGAMEMVRLDPSRMLLAPILRSRYQHWMESFSRRQRRVLTQLLKALRRLGEHLSSAAFYRAASQYGCNYRRAGVVMCGWIVAFALFFAFSGRLSDTPPPPGTPNRAWIALLQGSIHAMQVATFARDTHYKAQPVLGVAVETTERVVIPAQAALILFALRRQFRRGGSSGSGS
jgi:hypothetical protein